MNVFIAFNAWIPFSFRLFIGTFSMFSTLNIFFFRFFYSFWVRVLRLLFAIYFVFCFFVFCFPFDHSYVCCISPLSPFVIVVVVGVRCILLVTMNVVADIFNFCPCILQMEERKKCSFNHTIIWVIRDNKPSQFDTTICGITSFIEEHQPVFSKEMCTYYRENERSKSNQNTKMSLHVVISNNWQSWETFNGNFSLNLLN